VEIDHVKALRFRPDRSDLFLEAGVGWKPGVVGATSFSTDLASPPGRAFRTGQAVNIADLAKADDYRASPTLLEHGIVSLLNVPITVDGGTWGVLEVDSTVACEFSGDTEEFLVAAAAIIGTTIRRSTADQAHADAVAAALLEAQNRTLLLVEMQHRVKNNFQAVLAMLMFA